jgi:hypothetical protein
MGGKLMKKQIDFIMSLCGTPKLILFYPQNYFYSVSSRSSKLDTESESTNSSILIQRAKN